MVMASRECSRRGSIRLAAVLLIALLFLTGLGAQATISMKDEIELGREVSDYLVSQEGLTKDEAAQNRVKRIGARIVGAMEKGLFPYDFRVLATPEINALACPGGFLLFNQGLVSKFHSDDALAFVIAHEVAHATHRHYAQRLAKMERVAVLAVAASILVGDTQMNIANAAHAYLGTSYSRDDERGADRMALIYIRQAGYNVVGALDAMKILVDLEGGRSQPKYLSTHPPSAHRLELLKAQIEEYDKENAGKPVEQAKPVVPQVDTCALAGSLPEGARVLNPYYPLVVGNEWKYKVDVAGKSLGYTIRIIGCMPIEGGNVYRAETIMGESAKSCCQVLTTANALWLRHGLDNQNSPWALESVVTTDQNQVQNTDIWAFTVESAGKLSLPCGEFNDTICVKKRKADDPTSGSDIWYAKGIGMLKRVDIKSGYTEILQQFSVKPDTAVKQ